MEGAWREQREQEGALGEQVVASAGAKQRRLSQLAVTCCHRLGVSICDYRRIGRGLEGELWATTKKVHRRGN